MNRIEELKNQSRVSLTPVQRRNSEKKNKHDSCGGCTACHRKTGIRSSQGGLSFGDSDNGASGLNIQKPCSATFFQRNLGNSAMLSMAGRGGHVPTVQRRCSCGGSCGQEEELPTQAKLTVGPVDDIYEQEADRVAEQVMRMPEDTAISGERLAVRKKGETIQLKPGQTPEITPDIDLDRSGGRPLSDSTREYMEPRFGMDFGHVRVHADSDAHQTAEQINARAFTYGHHIWFGRGESENDRGLAAHELTHVVQQSIGLSTPMVQRVVRFSINTPLTINQWTPGTTTRNGMDWNVEYGSFEADADIHAEADDPAEFANWEVGFLETERIEWNRRYWQRPNTDYRGRFLERKLRIPPAPLRDHLNTAVVWTAPGEFASVSTIAAGGTAADVPLTTTDTPSSRMRVSASAQSGDVSDGTNNSYQFRAGINWVLYVSAHNSATDEWRHLELIYRSTQAAVDFRTDPAAGVVVDTDDRTQGQSRRFRWSPAADQPAIGGTLANDYVNDPTNWTLDRVEGWT